MISLFLYRHVGGILVKGQKADFNLTYLVYTEVLLLNVDFHVWVADNHRVGSVHSMDAVSTGLRLDHSLSHGWATCSPDHIRASKLERSALAY